MRTGQGSKWMILITLFVGLGLAASASAADYPTRPVELVVPYAPGGGTDIMYRQIAKVIEEEKLIPVALKVVNRSGGSGVVGKSYALNKPADGYTLVAVDQGNGQQELLGRATWNFKTDFTYIARMVTDVNLLIVQSDSPYNTLEEFLSASREKGKGGLTVAGTGTGGVDHVSNISLNRAAKVDNTYVAFNSGGEVMTNLLGGHTEAAWANPNECIGQLEAGKVKALGVTADARLKLLPDIPTMRERGVDVLITQWRAVGGRGGLPQHVVDFWEGVLNKVRKSEDWKKNYLQKKVLTDGWLTGPAFLKFAEEEYANYKIVYGELGMLKKK